MRPDVGFGAVEAVGEPIGGDETFNEEALLGRLWAEAGVVFDGEGFEVVDGFVGEEEGLGGDAELEGVEAGGGFAFGGAGSGGLFRVSAVGGELFWRCHRFESSRA